MEKEELEGFEIIDFFEDDYAEYWTEQIQRTDWEAAKYLVTLLNNKTFHKVLGEDSKLYLMTDGESLISFCTLSQKDDIPDTNLSPWIGFVYTFEEYRGFGCATRLINFVCDVAKKSGNKNIYISTNTTGLYEKMGFSFIETKKDVNGEDSRIYAKKLKKLFGLF